MNRATFIFFHRYSNKKTKLDSLPGAEALENPGQKDGQVLMIKQDRKAKAYQWSMSEHRWILVGDIVGDNTTPGRQLYKGVEYDYVFSIDIQDGVPPLKLPYNITEDAWVVAQTFIHKNNLSQMYLEQVANFIIKNSQSVPAMKSDSNYTDPFTGASRYVPGSASRNASRTSTETVPTANVASSSGTSVNSYIPHADYLRQEQGNLPEKIFRKSLFTSRVLARFNLTLESRTGANSHQKLLTK